MQNKLIAPNGLDKIKAGLSKLLYDSADIAVRYDEFQNNIMGFGPSSISEILHMVYPEDFCLWNEKPKTVLPYLELDILPDRLFKRQISDGDDYSQCVRALTIVKDELKGFDVKDFIDLDMFFWHIFPKAKAQVKLKEKSEQQEAIVKEEEAISINSHEAAEYYLLELGKTLGYAPYTVDQSKTFENKRLGDIALLQEIPPFAGERDMSAAKEIDVIWFNEYENPEYCIEVEHTTDIVHGLERLNQLQHLHVTFVIVAQEERRSKFEALLQRFPYRKNPERSKFVSYGELAQLLAAAKPFYDLKTRLLGEN